MITFKVVKQEYGWAVQTGAQMTTPFWSRALAIREAEALANAIRRHGVCAEVVIEEPCDPQIPDTVVERRGRGISSVGRWVSPR